MYHSSYSFSITNWLAVTIQLTHITIFNWAKFSNTCIVAFNQTVISQVTVHYYIVPEAIIGDGDRKSWDPRGPMTWDNFFYFQNKLCHPDVIYSRCFSHVSWVPACMLSRCMIKNGESCEFSQQRQGVRQGRRTRALLCTFML